MDLSSWVKRFDGGDVRALSRIISWVENSDGLIPQELKPIFSRTGHAFRIGITGPPGAGKSTLVDGLCTLYRKQNRSVGIIAVDPTSPFSKFTTLPIQIYQWTARPQDEFRNIAAAAIIARSVPTTIMWWLSWATVEAMAIRPS